MATIDAQFERTQRPHYQISLRNKKLVAVVRGTGEKISHKTYDCPLDIKNPEFLPSRFPPPL